jgi:hypothetical protein
LTGWQRAEAGEQAFGQPPAPTPPQPPAEVPSAQPSEVQELKQQAADLTQALEQIQRRLDELEDSSQNTPPPEATAE